MPRHADQPPQPDVRDLSLSEKLVASVAANAKKSRSLLYGKKGANS
jgi:hypothetical protein